MCLWECFRKKLAFPSKEDDPQQCRWATSNPLRTWNRTTKAKGGFALSAWIGTSIFYSHWISGSSSQVLRFRPLEADWERTIICFPNFLRTHPELYHQPSWFSSLKIAGSEISQPLQSHGPIPIINFLLCTVSLEIPDAYTKHKIKTIWSSQQTDKNTWHTMTPSKPLHKRQTNRSIVSNFSQLCP